MEVGVEAGAEPVEEGDDPEPGVGLCAWTAVTEGASQRPEQDVEDGAGHLRIPGEEPAEALWHREHPLPDRDGGDHVVGEVGGRCHAPRVAVGADAPALAGEGDQEVVAAAGAASAGEAVGQDAAAEIGPEPGLDETGHAQAQRIGLFGAAEVGLQMITDEPVEDGALRPAPPVDTRSRVCGTGGRSRPLLQGFAFLRAA